VFRTKYPKMERKLKRQQRTVGGILQIELEDGYHTYARILPANIAFYDCRTKENLSTDSIVQSPLLFLIFAYDYIITQGYWHKIGKVLPIEPYLLKLDTKPKYRENIVSGKFYVIVNGKDTEMKKEDIMGWESFTIWDYKNVENRLNDYYAGRFNQEAYDNLNGRQTSGMLERAKLLQEKHKNAS